jgi:hypothetical protein
MFPNSLTLATLFREEARSKPIQSPVLVVAHVRNALATLLGNFAKAISFEEVQLHALLMFGLTLCGLFFCLGFLPWCAIVGTGWAAAFRLCFCRWGVAGGWTSLC